MSAGWLAARFGLTSTLYAGLGFLCILTIPSMVRISGWRMIMLAQLGGAATSGV